MPIQNIVAGLHSAGVIPYYNDKPADLAQWERLVRKVNGFDLSLEKFPNPDPKNVVVDLNQLPQHWKDYISVNNNADPVRIPISQDIRIKKNDNLDSQLSTKERNTLLIIIGALAKNAAIDIAQPSKAGEQIAALTELLGASVDHSTIETKIKMIPKAVASRGN
jgi:hypothetical protein